jgi:4-amino-4-deoxy-L-arabinose transferase-like glycosyltransferase
MAGLACLAAAVLGGRVWEGDLIGDPVIYAALAKAMLARHDWGTMYLAGRPFFDKPPLVMWLAALSFRLFGVATWSARLPGVACSVLACLALASLGALLFDERVGLAAGAVLATTPGFVRFGSSLLLDAPFVLCALLGLGAMVRAWTAHGDGAWRAGAWFGLAFLCKGTLSLGAPAVLAVYWVTTPAAERPPFAALATAGIAFLVVALPWHLYELAREGHAFVQGYCYDVTEKLGGRPSFAVYVRALEQTTLPWLPVAVLGAWRTWRSGGERGTRLLVVWTAVAYAFLLSAAKHSPRYLMFALPALALWAALGVRPWLPDRRRLGAGLAIAGVVAWVAILAWPGPLHPEDTRAGVAGLEPDLGAAGTPVNGFRLKHEGTRARFAYYLDRDVRSYRSLDALAALGPSTPVVAAVRHASIVAADARFAEVRRTRDYVLFRVRPAAS